MAEVVKFLDRPFLTFSSILDLKNQSLWKCWLTVQNGRFLGEFFLFFVSHMGGDHHSFLFLLLQMLLGVEAEVQSWVGTEKKSSLSPSRKVEISPLISSSLTNLILNGTFLFLEIISAFISIVWQIHLRTAQIWPENRKEKKYRKYQKPRKLCTAFPPP